jgi:hypothetical protein
VALIAANVEEVDPYRRVVALIFTRLKQLGIRRDAVPIRAWRGTFLAPGAVYTVVTELLPILFTRMKQHSLSGGRTYAPKIPPLKGNTFDSQ